ncbi:MAG: hypothetical protein ACFB0E_01880 [Leptolyngbyaceae cyanobacterium]
MGVTLLILLFFLGALLATIGGIIGIVDAFRVNTVWGLLALLVPFALLVFCIKFWNQRKWARNSLIMSLLGLLAMVVPIPLGGLRLLASRDADQQASDDFALEADPSASDEEAVVNEDGSVEVPSEAENDGDLFEDATLPGLPTAAEVARAELLPSTDSNERFNEIDRERSDPYAFVPIAPPPRPTPPAPENGGGGNNGNGNNPNQAGGGNARPAAPNNQGAGGTQPNGGNAQPSPNEPLPDLPEPTVIASQVQITGVASVDGKTYAIVKAPNEPTSRYVQVGERIANGSVLVKRIENRSGTAPVVILEERGQEIALPVGANMGSPEDPAAEPETPQDLAAIPTLPPLQ